MCVLNDYLQMFNTLNQAAHSFVCETIKELMQEDVERTLSGRHVSVSFYNLPNLYTVRELRPSSMLGRLNSVQGTVTRTTEVRPELLRGAFECLKCSHLVTDVLQQFVYAQPKKCTNPDGCDNTSKWKFVENSSVFADWQKVKLQENASEIPPGSMPRSIDVVLRNDACEKVKPGDRVIVTGAVIVVPEVVSLFKPGVKGQLDKQAMPQRTDQVGGVSGLKQLGVRELSYKMSFLAESAMPIEAEGRREETVEACEDDTSLEVTLKKRISDEDWEDFMSAKEKAESNELWPELWDSVAPNVWGHKEIKQGILLMLAGGLPKTTEHKCRLRGDINMCIVGDPSTSKSQFLKWVHKFLPTCVYACGKNASSAGMTAAVTLDQDTGEWSIEAGALMLADNSVCCIDEFDKMND